MFRLLSTTALVAAGLMATANVASAQAAGTSAPIQVVVGGFMYQMFGAASNNDGTIYATGNGRTATAVGSRVNNVSQHSDAEIYVGGRTTLANGIVVGFDIQLEGNSDTVASKNLDQVDDSYLFIDGAFGRALLGTREGAQALMHYGAPAPGNTWGANGSYATAWVQKPQNVSALDRTIDDNDQQKISYFTPRMTGLQVGVSYIPNSLEDANGFTDTMGGRANMWQVSANYVNTFGGIRVAASGGYAYSPEVDAAALTTSNGHQVKDWNAGLQLGYGDWTVGGGYRSRDNNLDAADGQVWTAGVGYQSGPVAFSASYLYSKVNGTAAVGDDTMKQLQGSVAYTIGAGVDLIGAIFNVSYRDEAGAPANNNNGSGAVAGIRLAF